jgi:predicted Zn-dependent protease
MQDVAEDRAASLPVEELLALAGYARRWAEHGRVEDARTILEGLIDLAPNHALLRTILGCLYMRTDRSGEALAAFEAALEQDPRDIVALTCAGELCLESGQKDRGMDLLDAAIALDADGRDPHANRARTLRALALAEA